METARRPVSSNMLAKIMNFRSFVVPHKVKFSENQKDTIQDQEDVKKENFITQKAEELLLANLFARISAIKASYAELQVAQSPYDPEKVQLADMSLVSELKQISHLKNSYYTNKFDALNSNFESEISSLEAEEQKNLIKTFKITTHNLESELEKKAKELKSFRAQLHELQKHNMGLETQLNPKSSIFLLCGVKFSNLNPTHFLIVLRCAVKSIRSFVKLMVHEMEASHWDLQAAAESIVPEARSLKPENRALAFESFVCRRMFSGFHQPHFEISKRSPHNTRRFFEEFTALIENPQKQSSSFHEFARARYISVVHPKMEKSFFGNLNIRSTVCWDRDLPEMPFFVTFREMAWRVWLLHRLFFSFYSKTIFEVAPGSRFSEVYMESVDVEESLAGGLTVGFTVIPGFKVGMTVIQCRVCVTKL